MKYYLYKFSDNLIDKSSNALYIAGFTVLTEEQKDNIIIQLEREYKNGTRVFYNSRQTKPYNLEEIMSCIEMKKISSNEYQTLKRLFDDGTHGDLGPIELYDLDNVEERVCEECGDELGDDESDICSYCQDNEDEEIDLDGYEEEYNKQANAIEKFIKQEFSLEPELNFMYHSYFKWKPTPKAELEIIINEYDIAESVTLKLTQEGRLVKEEDLPVEEYYNHAKKLRNKIEQFIDKAKAYYN